jgi:hypothetical protein
MTIGYSHIANMALRIIRHILELHCRPMEESEAIDNEIQHLLFHLDQMVRQPPATYDTILPIGLSLGVLANVAAGHRDPFQHNHWPTSERGIVLKMAQTLRDGQRQAETKTHVIEKHLGVTQTFFPTIQSWDSLHPGVSTEKTIRDILDDYHKGYIIRALNDANPNPYRRSTDHELLRGERNWKVIERLIDIQWELYDLTPTNQPSNNSSSRPSYGTPSHPPKKLMEVILELA